MKKTIITALMLAAGVASAANFTSNSTIVGTNSNFPDVNVDVFSAMKGSTSADFLSTIQSSMGQFTYNNTDYHYITAADRYSGDSLTRTITLSSLHNSTDLDSSLILDSYSFISVNNTNNTSDIYLQVTVDGKTYTSSVVSYDSDATTNNIYGTGTFSFEGQNIRLDKDTAYTFTVVDADGTNVTNARYGVVNCGNYWTVGGVKQGYTVDGVTPGSWTAVVSIATHTAPAVPEPATATLSLLALAGLAARRRRK